MVKFDANLYRIASGFVSKDKSRHYLTGVYVEPAQKGVTLTATDGHRLICILDEDGEIDKPAIIKLDTKGWTKAIITALTFSDNWQLSPNNIVDGTYPNWRNVLPKGKREPDAVMPAFNARYLADFSKAAIELSRHYNGKGDPSIRYEWTDVLAPASVLFHAKLKAFGVLMPMRGNDETDVPAWAKWHKAPDEIVWPKPAFTYEEIQAAS